MKILNYIGKAQDSNQSSSKSPDSKRQKPLNKPKETLINKRFSKAPIILPSSQLSLKSDSLKYSSKGNSIYKYFRFKTKKHRCKLF